MQNFGKTPAYAVEVTMSISVGVRPVVNPQAEVRVFDTDEITPGQTHAQVTDIILTDVIAGKVLGEEGYIVVEVKVRYADAYGNRFIIESIFHSAGAKRNFLSPTKRKDSAEP